MTLTEFLLARIAEDEAAAVQQRYYSDIRSAEIGGRLVGTSARALAECEAKRRIVERVLECDREAELIGEPIGILGYAALGTLDILATVYGDHPDYDEAWRV